MFSNKLRGFDNISYDSKSEELVAKHFYDLVLEKELLTFYPHVKICGFNVDFWAVLQNKRPIIVEYDGLGLKRTGSLSKKVSRLSDLSMYGVELRWLTETSYSACKQLITNYQKPNFVWVNKVCGSCGSEDRLYLIDHNNKYKGESSVTLSQPCNQCK